MAIKGKTNEQIRMFLRTRPDGTKYWWHCPAFDTVTDGHGEKHFMTRHEPSEKCNIYQLPDGWFVVDNDIWMNEYETFCEVNINEDGSGNLFVKEPVFAKDDTYGKHPTYLKHVLKLVEEDVPIDFVEFE